MTTDIEMECPSSPWKVKPVFQKLIGPPINHLIQEYYCWHNNPDTFHSIPSRRTFFFSLATDERKIFVEISVLVGDPLCLTHSSKLFAFRFSPLWLRDWIWNFQQNRTKASKQASNDPRRRSRIRTFCLLALPQKSRPMTQQKLLVWVPSSNERLTPLTPFYVCVPWTSNTSNTIKLANPFY
jgi:hypothetical protein